MEITIGKYSGSDDPRVDDVLDALFAIVRRRSETQNELISRLCNKETSDEEFTAIQKQLDAKSSKIML